MKAGLSFKKLLNLLLILAVLLPVAEQRALVETDIVVETRFSDSDYFLVLKAWFNGMGWPGKYANSEVCRESLSKLLDDFHYMYKNHTAATFIWEDHEGRFFNVTKVISGNYADTFYYCFTFISEQHEYAVQQYASFVDDDDIYISFLFNMLGESIMIREYSYDLIDYGKDGPLEDFEKYTTSLAGIFSKLLYFESTAALPFNDLVVTPENRNKPLIMDKKGHNLTVGQVNDVKMQLKQILNSDYEPYLRSAFEKVRQIGLELDHNFKHLMLLDKNGKGMHLPNVQQNGQTEEREKDELSYLTAFEISFGLLDGSLNALPVGANLYYCGKDSGNQRIALLDMFEYYEAGRDLTSAVSEAYKSMRYVWSVSNNCYYGAKEFITGEGLVKLVTEYDIFSNILFNGGYMWTDIIMLMVGKNGETEVNYYYYVAFYVGDFIFRFIFRESYEGNCWYPWVICDSETSVYIDATAE